MTTVKTGTTRPRRCALYAAVALVAALLVATTFAQAETAAAFMNDTADVVQVVEFAPPSEVNGDNGTSEVPGEVSNCTDGCVAGGAAPPPPPPCPCPRRRFGWKRFPHQRNVSDAENCCAAGGWERQGRERHALRKHSKMSRPLRFDDSKVTMSSKKMAKKVAKRSKTHDGAAAHQRKLARGDVKRHAFEQRRGAHHNRTARHVEA